MEHKVSIHFRNMIIDHQYDMDLIPIFNEITDLVKSIHGSVSHMLDQSTTSSKRSNKPRKTSTTSSKKSNKNQDRNRKFLLTILPLILNKVTQESLKLFQFKPLFQVLSLQIDLEKVVLL